jgi:uncharacterized protein YodC (DUF2158 family)
MHARGTLYARFQMQEATQTRKALTVGEIVRHRRLPNSPRMRVKAIASDTVTCDWFDKNETYQTAEFPADELGDERGALSTGR